MVKALNCYLKNQKDFYIDSSLIQIQPPTLM